MSIAATNQRTTVAKLLQVSVILAIGWAAMSRSIAAALAAFGVLFLLVLASSNGPGLSIMLLTTGRYLYSVALLITLGLESDTTYAGAYFAAVDILLFLSLAVDGRRRRVRIPGSRTLFVALSLFSLSVLEGWIRSGLSPEGAYLACCYLVFALPPLIAGLVLTTEQVLLTSRWMFAAVAGLVSVYTFQAATGQVYWFDGRASLTISNIPQVGNLVIGSVIPIGLFAAVFLGGQLFSWIGLGGRWGSIFLRWVCVTALVTMLAFTGARSPLVALGVSTGMLLFLIPRIPSSVKLAVLAAAVILFTALSVVPNGSRYSVLLSLVQGDSGAVAADDGALMRLGYYRISLDSFLSSPILGAGLGSFLRISSVLTAFPSRGPHNAFLEILEGQGLCGAIPIALLIFATAMAAIKRLRRISQVSELPARLFSFLLASWIYEMALMGLNGTFFTDSTFWFLTGAIWSEFAANKVNPERPARLIRRPMMPRCYGGSVQGGQCSLRPPAQ
jgi:O-antigen ligase